MRSPIPHRAMPWWIAAAVLLTAGCAAGPDSTSTPGTTPTMSTTNASTTNAGTTNAGATPVEGSTSTMSGPPGPSGPAASSAPPGRTVLTGTITAGVERGCVVLVDDAGAVLASLQGVDPTATPAGGRVSVTGRWAADRVSVCQQGRLFAVTSVVPA